MAAENPARGLSLRAQDGNLQTRQDLQRPVRNAPGGWASLLLGPGRNPEALDGLMVRHEARNEPGAATQSQPRGLGPPWGAASGFLPFGERLGPFAGERFNPFSWDSLQFQYWPRQSPSGPIPFLPPLTVPPFARWPGQGGRNRGTPLPSSVRGFPTVDNRLLSGFRVPESVGPIRRGERGRRSKQSRPKPYRRDKSGPGKGDGREVRKASIVSVERGDAKGDGRDGVESGIDGGCAPVHEAGAVHSAHRVGEGERQRDQGLPEGEQESGPSEAVSEQNSTVLGSDPSLAALLDDDALLDDGLGE